MLKQISAPNLRPLPRLPETENLPSPAIPAIRLSRVFEEREGIEGVEEVGGIGVGGIGEKEGDTTLRTPRQGSQGFPASDRSRRNRDDDRWDRLRYTVWASLPFVDGMTTNELLSVRKLVSELRGYKQRLCGDVVVIPDAWRRYVKYNVATRDDEFYPDVSLLFGYVLLLFE